MHIIKRLAGSCTICMKADLQMVYKSIQKMNICQNKAGVSDYFFVTELQVADGAIAVGL